MKKKFLLIFMFAHIFAFFYSCRFNPKNDLAVEFRATIIKIEQHENGQYYIDLKTSYGKEFTYIDSAFNMYEDKIRVGDSVIKIINTTCFNYKRKDEVLVESCKSIKL
jgi:hypothetical protein